MVDDSANEGTSADGECGARASEAARLHDAEVKLERAQEERRDADRLEGEAREEFREVEEDIKVHHHDVHFEVDGEEFEISRKEDEQTPDHIIRKYAERDPATNYLVKLTGKEPISYQGKGNIPIKIHDCDQFQTVSIGPTPVSDGRFPTGVNAFLEGLRGMGFSPIQHEKNPDHISFDYNVPVGRYAGLKLKLGFVVPPDFPVTPPSGPHISVKLRPNASGGTHPSGGIHASAQFEQLAGGSWQYWSRPFTEWAKSKKTVAAYMGHVYRLWETQ